MLRARERVPGRGKAGESQGPEVGRRRVSGGLGRRLGPWSGAWRSLGEEVRRRMWAGLNLQAGGSQREAASYSKRKKEWPWEVLSQGMIPSDVCL